MKGPKLKELEQIPGVGKKIAQYMRNIGTTYIDDFKVQSAEELYHRLCDFLLGPRWLTEVRVARCTMPRIANMSRGY